MNSRRQILRAHYSELMKKVVTWAGLMSLFVAVFAPVSVNAAGTLTARKLTLTTSEPAISAANTWTFNFTTATTSNIGAFKFEICDSPLIAVACVNSGNSNGASFTAGPATLGSASGTGVSGFIQGTGGQVPTQYVYYATKAVPSSVTSATAVTVVVNTVKNPTAIGQFYLRIHTYSDTAASALVDEGSVAVSTTQKLSVTASVQEDLTFCVGTTGTACSGGGAITGTTVTLSPNPMTTSAPSKGAAVMAIATNGGSGYVITYNGTTFTNTTADTIASGGTATLGAGGGAEQFGFNLVANSAGNFGTFGAAPTNGGTATAPYATNNQIAYSTAGAVQVASFGSPTTTQLYTMSYGANVLATTKPGVYTATQVFIATAQF